MSSNKFLGTSLINVSDGSTILYGSKIGAVDLAGLEETIKLTPDGCLYASDLNIDNITGLQTELDNKLQNPMNVDLNVNNFNINNAQNIEIDNGSNGIILNYITGITDQTLDLQVVKDIEDVTQNFNTSTSSGQTDINGDLTLTGDFQLGGSLIGDLTITDISMNSQTTSVKIKNDNTTQLKNEGQKTYIYKDSMNYDISINSFWTFVSGNFSTPETGYNFTSGSTHYFEYDYSAEILSLETYNKFKNTTGRIEMNLRSDGGGSDSYFFIEWHNSSGFFRIQAENNNSISLIINQADWNIDTADGTQKLPNIDHLSFNGYKISLHLAGFVEFSIFNINSHVWQPVHRLNIANNYTDVNYIDDNVCLHCDDIHLSYVAIYSQDHRKDNINTLKGNPISVNSGGVDVGTQRVVIASDQPILELSDVYPHSFQNFTLIHNSNYAKLENTDNEYYEAILSAGFISPVITKTGYLFTFSNITDEFVHYSRFHSSGSKLLYLFSFSSGVFDGISSRQITSNIGLDSVLSNTLMRAHFLFVLADANLGTSKINIVIYSRDLTGTVQIDTIVQENFNIDKIDGTGKSGFNLNLNFASQEFWILHSGNELLFGLKFHDVYIPIHSFNGEKLNITATSSTGLDLPQNYRYRIQAVRDDNESGDLYINFHHVKILSDSANIYYNTYQVDNTLLITDLLETPIFTIGFLDGLSDYGNITLTELQIHSDKLCKLNIRRGRNNDLVLVGSIPTMKNNIEYDISATSYSTSGIIIQTIIIESGLTTIDLSKYIDWRLFGYNNNYSFSDLVSFSIQNLETVNLNLIYNFNIAEF